MTSTIQRAASRFIRWWLHGRTPAPTPRLRPMRFGDGLEGIDKFPAPRAEAGHAEPMVVRQRRDSRGRFVKAPGP